MKSIFIFAVILLIFEFINNVEGQGSPAASIGAYITRYKEKKRQKQIRDKQRRRPTTDRYNDSRYTGNRNDCNDFLFFYEPCRYY